MNDTTVICDNYSTTNIIKISIMEHDVELSFAETEDASLFDRLRQSLFQTYIQSLALPIKSKI